MATPLTTAYKPWIDESDCRLDDFRAEVARHTDLADYPHAVDVRENVLVYSLDSAVGPAGPAGRADPCADRRAGRRRLRGRVLGGRRRSRQRCVLRHHRGAARAGSAAGDHFGKPGANDRIWNAAQKLALHAPDVFAEYYANDALAVVSQAWLGPRYQVTSQVNVVNPGGKQQVPHRDYHLGFVAPDDLAAYPAHLHRTSPVLTLQGAVAHCDMPIESGPTMLLPYSQRFLGGYIAFNRPEFIEFFAEHHVQVPLRNGDAVFFNPALYHGAGTNFSTDIRRMANLLQISSPFGRAMEALDRTAMVRAVYPALLAMKAAGRSHRELHNVVVATAEGYAVPHQPRPRSADRQPRAAIAGRHRAGRAGRRLHPEELDVALRDQDDRRIP